MERVAGLRVPSPFCWLRELGIEAARRAESDDTARRQYIRDMLGMDLLRRRLGREEAEASEHPARKIATVTTGTIPDGRQRFDRRIRESHSHGMQGATA